MLRVRERFYYSSPIGSFLGEDDASILGKLVASSEGDVEIEQREAWRYSIQLLKSALHDVNDGHLLLEYTIPRMGKRIDAVVLLNGTVFVIEVKLGASAFARSAIEQVYDYALDLKYFHHASAGVPIVPLLVATEAKPHHASLLDFANDDVAAPMLLAPVQLRDVLGVAQSQMGKALDPDNWIKSEYRPTPTIIEAARALFRDQDVAEISRTEASAENLSRTAASIRRIVEEAKEDCAKSICLVTGVPGSGKTLAGLVIANERPSADEEHAVFLSGNGPLVQVLQEALARDHAEREGVSRSVARRKTKAFIQNIHHFRDDALFSDAPPMEKVTIFDEAQRAWDAPQLAKFMKEKKGVADFKDSEPEFLIGVMDRHCDWAVIVCLIGSGQEINTGEAGLSAWLQAVESRFSDWRVHLSPSADAMLVSGTTQGWVAASPSVRKFVDPALHLDVSIRSFRSECLSDFVAHVLSNDLERARDTLAQLLKTYPIFLTRDRDRAKSWLRRHARGSERFGQVASSRAYRLRANGVWVQVKPDPIHWFLDDVTDVRSSNALEETAREYDIQGLELDWALVCWDADLRYVDGDFHAFAFRGDRWVRIHQSKTQVYLTNAYRVLLTRARQGMVIFVPEGDERDATRRPEYYDGTYAYLRSLGIPEI